MAHTKSSQTINEPVIEAGLVDTVLGDDLQTLHDVSRLALAAARHVEADVAHALLVRQELIEVVQLLHDLFRQNALVSLALAFLEDRSHCDAIQCKNAHIHVQVQLQ